MSGSLITSPALGFAVFTPVFIELVELRLKSDERTFRSGLSTTFRSASFRVLCGVTRSHASRTAYFMRSQPCSVLVLVFSHPDRRSVSTSSHLRSPYFCRDSHPYRYAGPY